ncbi:MAG: UspA domain protein [Myxococcales bacterium]|nr:UspA domain protein [Myxococcales bacterium]
MIQQILIPTDFSDVAQRAVEYGCQLATRLGARVTLLHAFSPGIVALPDAVFAATDAELRLLEEAAQHHLRAIAVESQRAGLQIECVAVEGVAAETVTSYARQRQFDLIVMGTHGRRGLTHALLGSVAERVLRAAPCPVLTVGRTAIQPMQEAAL